ncbi:InlB B-repeat-containing protein, partial [Mesomycoplasma ovipneumoniae]|uniref:InlB B-repeat-containing protein n=1 Tax=Mesomycoplasma ovipneumoniae TaxID=29562 RepID=UPI00311A2367
TILYGDTVTFTATPDAGYAFDGWYDGETKVSSDAEYTFDVNEEVNLTANFKVPSIIELPVNDTTFEGYTLDQAPPSESNWTNTGAFDAFEVSNVEKYSGNHSLIINSANYQTANAFLAINARKDTSYTVRFYAKVLNSNTRINILNARTWDPSPAANTILNTIPITYNQTEWQEITIDIP